MPSYDTAHHEPPAPVASVSLRNPTNGVTIGEQLLLIDSGADVTLLPRAAVEQIGVAVDSGSQYQVAAFDGTTSFMAIAVVDMVFLKRVYQGKYLLVDAPIGVLGRDVLNHLRLILDGPGLQWREQLT